MCLLKIWIWYSSISDRWFSRNLCYLYDIIIAIWWLLEICMTFTKQIFWRCKLSCIIWYVNNNLLIEWSFWRCKTSDWSFKTQRCFVYRSCLFLLGWWVHDSCLFSSYLICYFVCLNSIFDSPNICFLSYTWIW